jgi:hypothetical protein
MKSAISFETMLSRSFECGEAQKHLKVRLAEGIYNRSNRWDSLTTKSGLTVNKCDYCIGRNSVNKNIYGTEQEALFYADVTLKEEGIRLRVYKCPHGFGWHRTKKFS